MTIVSRDELYSCIITPRYRSRGHYLIRSDFDRHKNGALSTPELVSRCTKISSAILEHRYETDVVQMVYGLLEQYGILHHPLLLVSCLIQFPNLDNDPTVQYVNRTFLYRDKVRDALEYYRLSWSDDDLCVLACKALTSPHVALVKRILDLSARAIREYSTPHSFIIKAATAHPTVFDKVVSIVGHGSVLSGVSLAVALKGALENTVSIAMIDLSIRSTPREIHDLLADISVVNRGAAQVLVEIHPQWVDMLYRHSVPNGNNIGDIDVKHARLIEILSHHMPRVMGGNNLFPLAMFSALRTTVKSNRLRALAVMRTWIKDNRTKLLEMYTHIPEGYKDAYAEMLDTYAFEMKISDELRLDALTHELMEDEETEDNLRDIMSALVRAPSERICELIYDLKRTARLPAVLMAVSGDPLEGLGSRKRGILLSSIAEDPDDLSDDSDSEYEMPDIAQNMAIAMMNPHFAVIARASGDRTVLDAIAAAETFARNKRKSIDEMLAQGMDHEQLTEWETVWIVGIEKNPQKRKRLVKEYADALLGTRARVKRLRSSRQYGETGVYN